ncbi:NADH-quinone oxidoreductase subunit C [Pedobacter aquae]|jgi:NADH-quinone oxidoreductase subunit C|uniref:NADH-quinone oxidoreductase subunit C n=1 Tax=Pedobacter aquae TaxID=2605747 RepID=A0A5C0VM44_9SPHI|nr:NADH-quinone oxidoreductase subunit C [Pedobacter aquae]QEK52671.1 NADH-quinone oxidoreductase subunit C [Pedobacter aquae]
MGKISNQHLIEKLTAKYGEQISAISEPYGLLTFEATRPVISELLAFLKNDEELKFNYLTDITAIHYPEKENALGVIYHLHSFYNNVRIRIKVFLPVSDPTIPTASVLWDGANWMERETFDFFGIQFTGHPDLRRILNVDDMTVFPMRREYPLEDPNRVDKKDYFFGR